MTKTSTDAPSTGIALMLGFLLVAPFIEVFAKLAGSEIPTAQISTARFVVQLAVLAPIAWALGRLVIPDRRDTGLYLIRGALIFASTFCIVAAVRYMPIADAIAIVFVEPLFLTLVGWLFLGDAVGWRRLGASLIGFCGCLMVIQPSFEAFGWVALLPLGTAVFFGIYLLLTRAMARRSDPLAMQVFTAMAALVYALPLLVIFEGSGSSFLDPVWPTPVFAAYLLGGGLAAAISHIFLTYAVRITPTTVIAPMQYLEIVIAAFLGYLIFGDIMNGLALVGAIVIVAAGLFVFWRERVAEKV